MHDPHLAFEIFYTLFDTVSNADFKVKTKKVK